MLRRVIFAVCVLLGLHIDWIYASQTMAKVETECEVSLTSKENAKMAFFSVNKNHDLCGIERQVRGLLTQSGFALIEDLDTADNLIDLSSSLTTDEVVTSGVSDLNTCYCGLVLRVYDNKSQEQLLEYSLHDVRVLTPAEKSYKQTLLMCMREVMKRVRRELPKRLGEIN